MESYQIKKPKSIKKRKRVGTGISAGGGKTCGRGMNGQKSRSGFKLRPWFEGGQMPLQRRVPKRGFTNIFRKEYQIVNLSQLAKLSDETIDPAVLKGKRLIEDDKKLVKILGDGELSKAVAVTADWFSKSAKAKIEKAGGKAILRENLKKVN